jgi:hypothetical protein
VSCPDDALDFNRPVPLAVEMNEQDSAQGDGQEAGGQKIPSFSA